MKKDLEALKRAFRSVFHDPLIDELVGDDPAVQQVPPEGTFHIDVLPRLGEAFRFEDVEAVRMPFGAFEVSFPPGLFRRASVEALNAQADAWEAERIERVKLRNARARAAANPEPGPAPTPGRG